MLKKGLALVCAVSISSSATAAVVPMAQPFQVDDEVARFYQGIPTVSAEHKNGAVQLTPEFLDHGSIAFKVVVYNDGTVPANFGTGNIKGLAGSQTLFPFTVEELQKAASSRAMWSQIGIALLAGAAAAAASTAHTTDTYRGRFRTPHGTYSWVSQYRDNSIGVLGATAATAAGVAGVVSIQNRLEGTLAMIGDQGVQMTTIEPGESYGGRIVMQKIKDRKVRDLKLTIDWNGETYRFGLHIPVKGEPAVTPVRTATAPSRAARLQMASAAASSAVPPSPSSISSNAGDPDGLAPFRPAVLATPPLTTSYGVNGGTR